MKKHLLIVLAIFIVLCLVAFMRKASSTDHVLNRTDFSSFIVMPLSLEVMGDVNRSDYLAALDQVYDEATLIIRAVFTGKRIPMYYATLSQITVLDVFKGDSALVGQNINIYERSFFDSGYDKAGNLHQQLRLINPSAFMKEGEEYYVISDMKKEFPTYRHALNEKLEYVGMRSSEIEYIPYIIPVDFNRDNIITMSQNQFKNNELTYHEFLDYQYLVYDEKSIEELEIIYNHVLAFLQNTK